MAKQFSLAHLTLIGCTPAELIHIAREERLYLGEGCVDFAAIFARLPNTPLSIELPNAKRVRELGYEGHARRCLETARQYVEKHSQAGGRIRP